MKKLLSAILCLMTLSFLPLPAALAAADEPTVYVIQKGDTLWGLSERFLNDPYYWPNLWARNPTIGNPHFIFPGDRLKVYPDRLEIEPRQPRTAGVAPVAALSEEPVAERTFQVTGSEGFLREDGFKPAGTIISTAQNRQLLGTDDIAYTDIGRLHGAQVGDRFSIYKEMEQVSHPVTNVILGERVVPLGTLQLTEVDDKNSKAIITRAYQEVGPGSFLLPYREKRHQVALRAADKDLSGYIVASGTGNNLIGEGDLVFLDLGKRQGMLPGYFFYVLREVTPDPRYADISVGKLPPEVIGAVVVVTTGENTSTALVVKSIDTIYRGDRVEMKKSR
ncbi:peptidoglycan-binding protein LysM [Geotalea uraniireducens]|uniref:Peptidoglycan-binding protein LysM n=1 Tax=Geotalea uraniireducens TaxID=351604 RepID=A0ABN6VUV3_9BACT|nr:LysM peptidoglycan-binding domain-containing protein [Geotalea uraniireducens]BDV44068.1 peptidoglycan-binding protein LysM [Geotalea uraniireducens]